MDNSPEFIPPYVATNCNYTFMHLHSNAPENRTVLGGINREHRHRKRKNIEMNLFVTL